MELYGATFLPDSDARMTGTFTVDWIEGGTAIAMRQSVGEGPPEATWIIGRDESEGGFMVLYADDRCVSRMYHMTFAPPDGLIWRTTRDFSQRFEAVVAPDGETIKGAWKKSVDGGKTWEHDFNLDYVRILSEESA
ncbi:MAG TPA: hypothetical protein VFB34_11625 [Chloroflexota bacterium]|nr:hypothetical protein [Chloroflexota bacterium]